jgi:hypothetical protein
MSVLNNAATIGAVSSFFGIMLGSFLIWRRGTSVANADAARKKEQAYKDLEEALKAASLRADEEKKRADQQTQIVSALEVRNAELLNSSTADQTRYLTSTKLHTTRIQELEAKLRSHE